MIIEDGETDLGLDCSFKDCPITTLYVGRNLSYIGQSGPFQDIKALENLTMSNYVTQIGNYAFRGCTGLTSVEIPTSVISIGGYAFFDCTGLTSIVIPNSVTSIDKAAFQGCTGLTSVTLPNSITGLYIQVFNGCSGLTSITLPSSIISMASSSLEGCSGLTTLYALPTTPPRITDFGAGQDACFTTTQYETMKVYVPREALEAYKTAEIWKNFKYLQGFDYTGIESVKLEGKTDAIYTINGVKLNTTSLSNQPKGIYIVNGKKYVVK